MSLVPEAEMSLSKYYKNSSSFEREDIFKPEHQVNKGWEPSGQQSPPEPFVPNQDIQQSRDAQRTTQNKTEPKTEESSQSAPNNGSASQSSDEVPQKKSKPAAPPVQNEPPKPPDPSKYEAVSAVKAKVDKAYKKGFQAATEKAKEDYGSATKSMMTICQQLETLRETLITNSSREILDFAVTIAERILRHSLKDSKTTVIATIEEALQQAVKSDEFYIYVSPDDFDTVVEKSDELIAGLSGLNNIVIKKDVTIEPGGAKIESENCTIDATVASQFELILEEIKKRQ